MKSLRLVTFPKAFKVNLTTQHMTSKILYMGRLLRTQSWFRKYRSKACSQEEVGTQFYPLQHRDPPKLWILNELFEGGRGGANKNDAYFRVNLFSEIAFKNTIKCVEHTNW